MARSSSPSTSQFADVSRSSMNPGEYLLASDSIELNAGRATRRIEVSNRGDRPIQVGSHFHFFEVNRWLSFDRQAAYGMRLDVPPGTSSRTPWAAWPSNDSQRFTSKKWKCEPTWIGRSPRLLTSIRRVARPAFNSIGSDLRKYSPGII